MKVQLASDLHLEYLQRNFPGERLISPVPGADLLVLAGDIAGGVQTIEFPRTSHQPIFKVEFSLNNSDSVSAGTALL